MGAIPVTDLDVPRLIRLWPRVLASVDEAFLSDHAVWVGSNHDEHERDDCDATNQRKNCRRAKCCAELCSPGECHVSRSLRTTAGHRLKQNGIGRRCGGWAHPGAVVLVLGKVGR